MKVISTGTLAVIGLDASWGGCGGSEAGGVNAFERMVYAGGQCFVQPGYNPRQGQVEEWLEQSYQRALVDAGIKLHAGQKIIVYYACHSPAAPRFPSEVQVVDLSPEANPLAAALEQAAVFFANHAADAVVFVAASGDIDWGSIPASESVSMGFDRSAHSWKIGIGAGAAVFMPSESAWAEKHRVYALLGSLVVSNAPSIGKDYFPAVPVLEDVRSCSRAALDQAGVTPDQVGYIEVFASGSDALDGVEIAGLCQAYRLATPDLTTAIGSAQANVGYLFSAAGLAGLIRACLCLYHRFLPVIPGWSAPKLPALWKNAPFYAPVDSKGWFSRLDGPGRLAGLNLIGRGGSFGHLILSEDTRQVLRPNLALSMGGFHLFSFAAQDFPDLLDQLEELQSTLPYASNLYTAAAESYETAQDQPDAPYGLALLGHNHEELLREIELALKSLPNTFDKGGEWQTPLGSYFTSQPAGRIGSVALVYPGAFNSYPWVGKDLFHLFPWLLSRSYGRTTDLGRVIRDRQLYPRSLQAPTKEELAAFEANLLGDAVAMLTSGTTTAILFTYILEEAFGIRPHAVFGYSLGENSMMYASQIWQEGDIATQKLETSPVFLKQLAGPQNAVRRFWGLQEVDSSSGKPLWNNYILMASWDAVRPALENEEHVYLTHINAPRQVVIGGDPDACKRVIAALRCSSLQAPFDYALHCKPMRSEYDGLADLHNYPVEVVPPVKLYSAAEYQPLDLQPGVEGGRAVSQKIAHMLTSPLDFPRLVRKVYEDGARVFIEAGAGSNCTRWVDESLKGLPHVALSVNRRGTDDYTSLVRLLARLHSHRVPMNLSTLYLPLKERVSL